MTTSLQTARRLTVGFAAYRELGRGAEEASLPELSSTIRLPRTARDVRVGGDHLAPEAATLTQQLALLANGDLAASAGRTIGARSELARKEVAHQLIEVTSGRRTEAVIKPPAGGSAREVYAFDAGRELGISHLMAPVALRDDGSSAMQVVRGRTWHDQRIYDGYGIEHALRGAQFARQPASSLAEIARRARVDRQLVQSFDHVFQNWDRHSGNGMYDARTGAFHLIDNAGIFTPGPLKSLDWIGSGARQVSKRSVFVPLLPEAVARWQGVDRAVLARNFETMRQRELQHGVEPASLDAFRTSIDRIDGIIESGGFRTEGSL